jgi:enediyne polyketide synthase
MTSAIAIVGMACRYPDAQSPAELWENVLAQRRAFRRMPDERLRLDDYYSADPTAGDSIYITQAAVLKNYEFDRTKFRVAGSTFRQSDLAHWLALDVAAQALDDSGFPAGAGLTHETTGVILGNTLTGEFSRANLMRLRWPYVRRVVEAALVEQGWGVEQRHTFLHDLEEQYKAPFPPIGEETLAGGLSNTIAGRICNHFDLKGGGYTVDGACASSLLAITTACASLAAGDLDIALAGGVDLSLDPFELVGFARTNALAPDVMRVYDRRSAGFWPGEGCGFVVLMRAEDALAQQRRVYGLIRGWGISSDGSGGITRPEVEGQVLAVNRAYQRAGYGVETVRYFEGHGTGTAVGDATELRTIARARQMAGAETPPAVIGSVKANIGHTKAAAGVAGLIKATLALHHQLLPPNTGTDDPHPEMIGERPALRVLAEGQPWPVGQPLRAGVSAMGFGGINTHLALESNGARRRRRGFDIGEHRLLATPQDAELFLLAGRTAAELQQQAQRVLSYAGKLALAELTDLAAELARRLTPGAVRAALVAATPTELAARLETLLGWLAEGVSERLDVRAGLFLGSRAGRIGLLFPGQGARVDLAGGVWQRLFATVAELYATANLSQYGYQGVETAVAQPAIITAALAGLRVLDQLGVEAVLAVGHSLGELAALHWAGAMDEAALLRIAAARGQAMMELGSPTGMMAAIGAGQAVVQSYLNGEAVTIACLNTPAQTVIAGETAQVAAVVARAQAQGVEARPIAVSHAFHSPLVAAAARPLAAHLATEEMAPLQQTVISTVTGAALPPDADLIDLLQRQVTEPVRFIEAVTTAAREVDLFIEAGPGRTLTNLTGEFLDIPTIALNVGGPSFKGLLGAAGATFALGGAIRPEALFAERFSRPFDLDWQASFLVNPCELAPIPSKSWGNGAHEDSGGSAPAISRPVPLPPTSGETISDDAPQSGAVAEGEEILSVVRRIIAARVELPLAAVGEQDRLLSDLHLNSITVTQIVAEAARQLGIAAPLAPTEFANLTVVDVAQSLAEMAQQGPAAESERMPAGVDTWVRAFTVDWMERPRPQRQLLNGEGWQLFTATDYPHSAAMQAAFAQAGGGGVVVCLPPEPDESHVGVLLQAAQTALSQPDGGRFVLAQHGGGAASLARTLHLEAPHVAVCVVDTPVDQPEAPAWTVAEALATGAGFTEVRYDSEGRRWEPVLRLLPLENDNVTPDSPTIQLPLSPQDVLLVTGGGKGITAECALSLAQATGAKLALFGRSQVQADEELAANLDRLLVAGVNFQYFAVDVTDAAAVRAAVRKVETTLGRVTAILHGAARNAPQTLRNLTEMDFQRTLAPKLQGMRNLLNALDPGQLRLVLSFGSIIARLGLPGEADYGLANEWLARLTESLHEVFPQCRCLTIDWSVWAGAGMGERLGTLEGLMRQGIAPIPLETGVGMLHRLLEQAGPLPAAVIVAGRYGQPGTVRTETPALPFWRFLEQVRVHYPGIELVVDATLSGESDPYLADHVYQGERLFLAVLGLEAMAQAAMALTGSATPPLFTDVQFLRPIVAPEGAQVTIRLAALRRETGEVEVALRSAESSFQADHFRAVCRFDRQHGEAAGLGCSDSALLQFPALRLDPNAELYEKLFFHKGRFRRVQGYRQVTAREMLAEISPGDSEPWFGRLLPPDLVLGDPSARDATIHAIQVCVPAGTLLPIGVERVIPGVEAGGGPHYVHARERMAEATADTLVFDVAVLNEAGCILEQWQGLRLKRVGGPAQAEPWSAPVLGPYAERRLRELLPCSKATVVVAREVTGNRRQRSDLAMQRAIGNVVPIQRRPDGKPGPEGALQPGWAVSAAHAGELTLAVAAPKAAGPAGCDLEPVTPRSLDAWRDLLGADRMQLVEVVTVSAGEKLDAAATRVWAALEALKKAGAALTTPLMLEDATADGWVVFAAGPLRVATYVAVVQGMAEPLALAILVRCDHATVL